MNIDRTIDPGTQEETYAIHLSRPEAERLFLLAAKSNLAKTLHWLNAIDADQPVYSEEHAAAATPREISTLMFQLYDKLAPAFPQHCEITKK